MRCSTMNNAIENIWNAISFPKSARISKRVPKKRFLESGKLTPKDKKLFRENVKSVYWDYALIPTTCAIPAYIDNEREYLEVDVLQIEMKTTEGYKRIAEVIHKVIPHPLMLGFYTESGCVALSIAPKRFSKTDKGAFVVERFYTTDWMNYDALKTQEAAFLDSLAWISMPLQTYLSLYIAWTDRFAGYECAILSGFFTIGETGKRLEQLKIRRKIESRISGLRRMMKKAAFNRKVELNTQIKKFEQELKQLDTSQ